MFSWEYLKWAQNGQQPLDKIDYMWSHWKGCVISIIEKKYSIYRPRDKGYMTMVMEGKSMKNSWLLIY